MQQRFPRMIIIVFCIALVAIGTSGGKVVSGDHTDRPFGDSRVFVKLPASPGFPESIAINGDKVYVAGPAAFGTAGTGPSKILVYNVRTGEFVREYVITGQDLSKEHV